MKIIRRVAYELHLWLGVASGLILFVVCLSGTLLTFKTEIIQYIERERYYFNASNGSEPKSIEELVALIEKAENGKVVRVTIPNEKNQAWIFNIKKEDDTKKLPAGMPAVHAMLGTAYLVNPFTGESLGAQHSRVYMFFMILTFLHRFLLLNILLLDFQAGQIIVGGATLIFLVIVFTGLVLWLPSKLTSIKNWSSGMKIRLGRSWSMFLYDVHNTLGFYILIPVVVMALTGPIISFGWYRFAFERITGARPFRIALEKSVQSEKHTNIDRLKWDDFIKRGNEITKRKGITRLVIPQTTEGSVVFQKIGAGLCNIAATDKIQFDQYSGNTLKSDLFDELPLNEKIASLIFPLHNGEIFGTTSKIIYFVTCLIATSLPITGVILWIRKLKSHYKRRAKKLYN